MANLSIAKKIDLAAAHFQAGRYVHAEQMCRAVLAEDQYNAEAYYLLGKLAGAQGDSLNCLQLLQKVFALVPHPNLYADLYQAYAATNQHALAARCFQALVGANPNDADAWYQLGLCCFECKQYLAAVQAFHRAHTLRAGWHLSCYHLALAYQRDGQFVLSREYLLAALQYAPDEHQYHNALGNLLKLIGRADEADKHYQRALELVPGSLSYASNYLMNLLCRANCTDEQVFQAHQQFGQRLTMAGAGKSVVLNHGDEKSSRRLRVAYLSSDFYCHPVAFFIEPVITLHDREAFELFIYANVEREDEVTAQFRERLCHWRNIHGLPDKVVAKMVSDDRIDILVELGGHTKNNRLALLACRLAPVQATWLGYANTTGLSTIDYRISDAVADPPGMTEHLHTEELWRLPLSFICYHPPQNPPDIRPLAAEQRDVTFVAFNNLAKCNQPLIRMWAAILKELPNAVLVMKDKGFATDLGLQEELLGRFAAEGISALQIRLLGKTPTVHQHLERLSEGDIALDSYPYTGTTTTCEALYMGVPVVTLAGSCHVKRVSASLLTAVGASELIAHSEDEYVRIAVELARDRKRLQYYRTHLRTMMEKSPLMDVEGFTRKLEWAYRQMWQRYCDTVVVEVQA